MLTCAIVGIYESRPDTLSRQPISANNQQLRLTRRPESRRPHG